MRPLITALATLALTVASANTASAVPPPWYPPTEWRPAFVGNFSPGRNGATVKFIVVHATDGMHAGTLSWFSNPHSRVSSHYVVRASDGSITQMVPEADTAFHVRGWNRESIGIEHEFDPRRGIRYTDAQYRSSAALVCAIARRYAIPLDRTHVVGHSELPGADHADPGPSWDWSRYMSYVRACGGDVPTLAVAAATSGAAAPGLAFGARGDDVQLLHWNLVRIGLFNAAQATYGNATFGRQTEAALRTLQGRHGLPTTGFYGPQTSALLARLLQSVPAAAVATLTSGTTSSEVTRLQTDLRLLGYLDRVTGYYGPLTEEAVRRFQSDRGIATTGTYGPITSAALASAR